MATKKYLTSLLAALMLTGGGVTALVSPTLAHAQEQAAAVGSDAENAVENSAPPAIEEEAPAPAPLAASVTDQEVVDNPYGIDALWKQGDFVSRGTLIILLIMSFGSWYILAIKLYEQYKLRQQAKHMQETFWAAGSIEKGIAGLSQEGPFRYIAETTRDAVGKFQQSSSQEVDLNSWIIMTIQRAVDSVQARMQDGLSFLATVGSTAPFVGLFGTVWGIYHALTAIGISGQASIDKVAGPVGEALIMTAIGLAVAVPAVLSYNWLVRRNKLVMEDIRGFSSELHTTLLLRGKNGA
ncbi:MotA/TolQ/ExbB proton channel family protein [Sterolibacterium denitrificans]|uniref:Biopolymer transport protein ExbB n=2 Tax=Sterolibacterium denitrificans TaxID=157592 RepID=A0A656Z780_9PROT|nr:MotA/TolQ/ExbB proton channel family protein [Sterolibacterium denitrificans]KYC28969.1 biopolymer transporter ExbB [Sterolibacterium denitrificans]SMB23051.1 MotA/TolQ/ExbB proton channel family protein [Sterolibacterium denitrificans]